MFEKNGGKARLLIVDDEPSIRKILCELLGADYECGEAISAEAALTTLAAETFDLVISDIQMGGMSGLEMIPRVAALAPDAVMIMISGIQDIESAIKAMRAGAFDYISKPFDFDHVKAGVARALDHRALRQTKKLYENHLEELVAERTEQLRQEVFERQRAEEKINRMAYYDLLTNLPNPSLFRDRLTHELSKAAGKRKTTATIFLALDRFTNVGDALGHAVADELLREFAARLSRCIRKTDTAAYFGGSEFAVLASELAGAEDCAKIARKIKDSLRAPFDCGGRELYLTASFGISAAPDDGDDCQTLLKNASAALYQARQTGDDYRFYTTDMNERALKSLSLENHLRRALKRDEFVLHYQPQISARTGDLNGVEALVRWQHPELGLVPPNEFIPIAEEAGLIVALGEWVLQSACRQNAAWQRAGFPALRVGVNLSLRQFQQKNFVDVVKRILRESRLDPHYLELELTESSLMNDPQSTIETLRRLRNLGVKISVDDFGSGYSSLSYLKNLPIDTLKIDRTFVTDLALESSDAAIVKTIITLAHNLGLRTIAEGVETEDQADILSAFGCDEMQGYLFSRPVAAAALESLLGAPPRRHPPVALAEAFELRADM